MHIRDEIWKKQFSRVLSHDLYWENKTYKLKRSVGQRRKNTWLKRSLCQISRQHKLIGAICSYVVALRSRPHASGYFSIRNFLFRIHKFPRPHVSGFNLVNIGNRACVVKRAKFAFWSAFHGKELGSILLRHRIKKISGFSVHVKAKLLELRVFFVFFCSLLRAISCNCL